MGSRSRSWTAAAVVLFAAVLLWAIGLVRGPGPAGRQEGTGLHDPTTLGGVAGPDEHSTAPGVPPTRASAPVLEPAHAIALQDLEVRRKAVLRGRLAMKGTGAGPPGESSVSVVTGNPEIDYAGVFARLGGPDAVQRVRSMGEVEAQAIVEGVGGWKLWLSCRAELGGRFEIAVPEVLPEFRLLVESDFARLPEGIRLSLTLEDARQREVVLELEPAGRIEVLATDPAGGRVAGARVAAVQVLGGSRRGHSASSDGEGRSTFRGAALGRWRVAAVAPGWSPSEGRAFDLAAGETARVELTLAPESSISGIVLDEAGKGVGEAWVNARRDDPEDLLSHLRLGGARARSDGSFRIGSLPAGTYLVQARAQGLLGAERKDVDVAAGSAVEGIRIVLPSGATVSGRVLDPSGGPAALATVHATFDAEGYGAKTRRNPTRLGGGGMAKTGSDGSFRIAGLEEGPFVVHAVGPEGGTAEVRAVDPGADRLELRLSLPTGVAGRVLDGIDRSPVRGFRIQAMRWTEGTLGRSGGGAQAFEAVDGAFQLKGLRPGLYTLEVSAPGFGVASVEKVEVVSGEVRDGVEVLLPRDVTIRGRVVDVTGAPVAGAVVAGFDRDPAFFLHRPSSRRPAGLDRSGEDGSFEVTGVGPETSRMRAQKEGFAPFRGEPFEAVAGATIEGIRIVLSGGGGIDGYAWGRDGRAWDGARAWAASVPDPNDPGGQATADASGYFRIEHLPPGEYEVRVEPSPERGSSPTHLARLRRRVRVEEGAVARVDFGSPAGTCTLRGRLLRADQPVGGARISAAPALRSSSDFPDDVSAPDGSFEIRGVEPGPTRLMVELDRGRIPDLLHWMIEVPPAEEFTHDILLPPGEIRGRVVRAADGAPVAGVEVSASPSDRSRGGGRPIRWGRAVTDAEGEYRIQDLPPGEYGASVRPRDGDLAPSEAKVVVVGEEVPGRADFILAAAGSVVATVLDPDGRPVPDTFVWVQRVGDSSAGGGMTDHRGRMRRDGLAPGRYRAATAVEGLAPALSGELSVEAGSEASCTLALRRGVEVRIRVLGEEGPLSDPRIRFVELPAYLFEGGVRKKPEAEPGLFLAYLAPGEYRFVVEPPGLTPVERTLVVGDSAVDLSVRVESQPPPR